MKRFTGYFSLLLAIMIASFSAGVLADVDVHLLTAGSSSSVLEDSSTSRGSGWGIGYGAMFFGRLTPKLSLRLGGVTMDRKTTSSNLSTRSSLFLPMLFGYGVIPGVRLELGGYYDYGLGTPPSGLKSTTFGALGGVALDLPLIPGVGFLMGGHYALQLRSLSASASSEIKYSDLVVTAGMRLGAGR